MPSVRWSGRAPLIALGLSLTLLADALAAAPALGADDGTPDPADPAPVEALAATADALACSPGFGDVHTTADMSLHGVALTDGGAIAVGFSRRRSANDLGRRKPAALIDSAGNWSRIPAGGPGQEDGLVAVSAADGGRAWAVGFTTIDQRVMPLAMRWNGSEWAVNRPRPRGELPMLLTDVVTVGDDAVPFAVGYRMTPGGKRQPVAVRKAERGWKYINPGTGPRESISLTGIARDRQGGLWAVGHGGRGAEIGPVIYRRGKSRWQRQPVPRLKGEAVLADVVARPGGRAWAVGYQRLGARTMPLVLRWTGKRWIHATAPSFDSDEVVLTAVSAPAQGGIWVVGAAWNEDIERHEAVAAWWDGQGWNEVSGTKGGSELHDVVGSPSADGWAVGRAGRQARTTRVCTPAQASIFGGSEPSAPVEPIDGLAAGAGTAEVTSTGTTADTTKPAEASGSSRTFAAKRRKHAPRRAKRRNRLRPLPQARFDKTVYARNVAKQAGIGEPTTTYGAVVADFDGDGDDDLYIGRHGARGRLMLNDDGVFTDHEPMRFPAVDRHGCAAADIDGSGLPDLYCAVGSQRGSSLKANELWIDPGGPAPIDIAVDSGVSDAMGRGRNAAFLDVRKKPTATLVVTNSPTRIDGLPSVGRLFRTQGAGDFSARSRTGFAPRLGSLSAQDIDFDRDGREDLLMVTGGLQAPEREGTRLYRNTKRGLVDVTRRMGIRSFAEVDAVLVDLDRDRKPDLVQLSPTKLRVSLYRRGRYVPVYERSLRHGRAIAGGDADGDKRNDLYIVRSNGERNTPDIMLLNRRNGRRFASMTIPQVFAGDGDDVLAIDHDQNGLDDFLVLNGRNDRGPTELIAFYRRQVARNR